MGSETSSGVPCRVGIVVLVVVIVSLSGCISAVGDDGSGGGPQCKLTHEVVDQPGDYADAIETYEYENLSDEAQHAFDEARANGSYATTDRDRAPPEFRYWDEAAAYNVTYRNQTYKLLTYSGEGCEP